MEKSATKITFIMLKFAASLKQTHWLHYLILPPCNPINFSSYLWPHQCKQVCPGCSWPIPSLYRSKPVPSPAPRPCSSWTTFSSLKMTVSNDCAYCICTGRYRSWLVLCFMLQRQTDLEKTFRYGQFKYHRKQIQIPNEVVVFYSQNTLFKNFNFKLFSARGCPRTEDTLPDFPFPWDIGSRQIRHPLTRIRRRHSAGWSCTYKWHSSTLVNVIVENKGLFNNIIWSFNVPNHSTCKPHY